MAVDIKNFGGPLFLNQSAPVGSKAPIIVDISSTDHIFTVPIRMITAIS
jgi:hypothetical protein